MTMTRREFGRMVGMGAAAITAAEWGRPPGLRAEERFTMASTGGSWGDGIREAFVTIPEFEKTHNVKVAYSQQLESVAASKVLANCGKPVFSVTSHSEGDAVLMADGGCLQAYDPALTPNVRDLYPAAVQPPRQGMDHWYTSMVLTVMGVCWNTRHAKKPTTWKDLWSSAYKGRVGVPAYGWHGINWLHAINRYFGGTPDNVSPGIEAIAELVRKNNAHIVENVDHGNKLFQQGEVVIMPFWNGRTYALEEGGHPAAFEYVDHAFQAGNGFSIPKGTAFAALANHFINNTLDPVLQLTMTRRFKYPPSNRKAQLPPEMERYRIAPAAAEKIVQLDWKKVNDHRSEYLERWNREVLG